MLETNAMMVMTRETPYEVWYPALVEDCKAIITEAVFTSRWALVEGYWLLGKRLRQDSDKEPITKLLQRVAVSLGKSSRTLWDAVQAYDKYPNLNDIPEGKNISWHKLVNKYLPSPAQSNTPQLPNGKYRVIYADPPWEYGNNMPTIGDSIHFGAQENHYLTMPLDDICELPIKDMAEDNAVLFLWATSPILEDAFKVIKAWGFEYKASFVWDKEKHVMGHYNSVRHEFLLLCVRGTCPLDNQKLFDSVYVEARTDHSKKPEYFRNVIDTIYPNGKRIELFAREEHDNWKSWGNEIP